MAPTNSSSVKKKMIAEVKKQLAKSESKSSKLEPVVYLDLDKEDLPTEKDAALHDEDDLQPQEYTFYSLQRWNRRVPNVAKKKVRGRRPTSSNLSEESVTDQIDEIGDDLVAQLKLPELHQAVKTTGHTKFLKTALSWMTANGSVPLCTDKAKQSEYLIKKRINLDDAGRPIAPRITPRVSKAIRHLKDTCGLFRFAVGKKSALQAKAGAFFVMKQNGKLRVIIDGRVGNSYFDKSKAKFGLFTLETVRQVIDNLSSTSSDGVQEDWFAVNLDLRHWFHQIPLQEKYKIYFGLELTDQDQKTAKAAQDFFADFFAYPVAVPMGWIMAPFIAQCCTLALLLADDTKENRTLKQHADVDIVILQKISEGELPPTWIPFKSGGGIFVLLDNILIVTPKREVADFWKQRIAESTSSYHAIIKFGNNEHITEKEAILKALNEQCYFHMKPQYSAGEKEAQFTFLGVDWRYNSHKISVGDDETKTLPGYDTAAKKFASRRDVASILGKLMWHRRVHRTRYYDGSAVSKAIMEVYSKLTPDANSSWNDSITLAEEDVKGLEQGWKLRLQQTWSAAKPLSDRYDASKTVWAAADAAGSSKIAAAVYLPNVHNCPALCKRLGEFPPKCKEVADFSAHGVSVEAALYDRKLEIAEAELEAIWRIVQKYAATKQLIIIATDNMNAKNWCENGHSKRPFVLETLKKIDEALGSHCRLYLVYINTTDNVADCPTRNGAKKVLEVERLRNTLQVLRAADFEARGLWLRSGSETGGVAVTGEIRGRDEEN